MSGIYIHIPYCKQKCTYCNFHFSTTHENVEEMINAMLIEIENKKKYLKKKRFTQYILVVEHHLLLNQKN